MFRFRGHLISFNISLKRCDEWGVSENHIIDFQSNSTVPPSIVDEGTVLDTKVKEKHNITLTCEASGKLHHIYISDLTSNAHVLLMNEMINPSM